MCRCNDCRNVRAFVSILSFLVKIFYLHCVCWSWHQISIVLYYKTMLSGYTTTKNYSLNNKNIPYNPHSNVYNKKQSLTRVHFPLLILQQRNAIKLAPGLKAQKTSDLIINWYIIVHYSILRVRLWLLLLYYCSKFLML